jgi:hypothetical protein
MRLKTTLCSVLFIGSLTACSNNIEYKSTNFSNPHIEVLEETKEISKKDLSSGCKSYFDKKENLNTYSATLAVGFLTSTLLSGGVNIIGYILTTIIPETSSACITQKTLTENAKELITDKVDITSTQIHKEYVVNKNYSLYD